MDGAGADGEGEVETVAQAVGEVELGGGESDVVGANLEDGLGVQLGADVHVVLEVDAALGEAGAAGAVEPEGHVVARGGRGGELRAAGGEQRIEVNQAGAARGQ